MKQNNVRILDYFYSILFKNNASKDDRDYDVTEEKMTEEEFVHLLVRIFVHVYIIIIKYTKKNVIYQISFRQQVLKGRQNVAMLEIVLILILV